MRRASRNRPWRCLLRGGVVGVIVFGACGCASSQPRQEAPADSQPSEADMITDSDTERAKAAIERNRTPGNRPPAAPSRRPIVDQPQARPAPRP